LPQFQNLPVVLHTDHYRIKVKVEGKRKRLINEIFFRDNGKAHKDFWARYKRPPKEEFHGYMQDRHDLLVPQEIRERKGSFFTPQIWVEKAQEYLAKVFGENWQDEYYVWDCAAGTGNLLLGLVNPYRIWASTIDQSDIDIIHTSISNGRNNLLESHVFQFDFLNGKFDELPESLQAVINDEEKQKRLIIFINPPYAEVSSFDRKGKPGVNISQTHEKYSKQLGTAGRELFTQFFIRILRELPYVRLASFGKLKYVCGAAFQKFRQQFLAEYLGGFVCRSNTFDNVAGQFPIGFLVWNLNQKQKIEQVVCDVLDNSGYVEDTKTFYSYSDSRYISDWISSVNQKPTGDYLGFLAGTNGNAFQDHNIVYILNHKEQMGNPRGIYIAKENLIESCIYNAVRHCLKATWLNDRDQFLYPDDKWKRNEGFQTNCLIYTLFHSQNRIKSTVGVNHWIPFTAREVSAKDNFKSTFMSDFLANRKLSKEAQTVFESGKALWTYYHEKTRKLRTAPVDASLYEIREYFKGRDEKGKMKTKAYDDRFNELDLALRSALKRLAAKIAPKVYEYGFLKK
jgi:hypothetical protein